MEGEMGKRVAALDTVSPLKRQKRGEDDGGNSISEGRCGAAGTAIRSCRGLVSNMRR